MMSKWWFPKMGTPKPSKEKWIFHHPASSSYLVLRKALNDVVHQASKRTSQAKTHLYVATPQEAAGFTERVRVTKGTRG